MLSEIGIGGKANLPLEDLLAWSKPNLTETRMGQRLVRRAIPNQSFWEQWRDHKDELKSQGISLTKQGRTWEVVLWQKVPGESGHFAHDLTVQREAEVALDAVRSNMASLTPKGQQYLPFQSEGIRLGLDRASKAVRRSNSKSCDVPPSDSAA